MEAQVSVKEPVTDRSVPEARGGGGTDEESVVADIPSSPVPHYCHVNPDLDRLTSPTISRWIPRGSWGSEIVQEVGCHPFAPALRARLNPCSLHRPLPCPHCSLPSAPSAGWMGFAGVTEPGPLSGRGTAHLQGQPVHALALLPMLSA